LIVSILSLYLLTVVGCKNGVLTRIGGSKSRLSVKNEGIWTPFSAPFVCPRWGFLGICSKVTRKLAGKGTGQYRIWTKYRVVETAQKARH
jgi:hypothetical protein